MKKKKTTLIHYHSKSCFDYIFFVLIFFVTSFTLNLSTAVDDNMDISIEEIMKDSNKHFFVMFVISTISLSK